MTACRTRSIIGLVAGIVFLAMPVRALYAADQTSIPAYSDGGTAGSMQQDFAHVKEGKKFHPQVDAALSRPESHRFGMSRVSREYRIAASRFPAFCKKWGRLIRQRKVNDVHHIHWQARQGWETGTYVGYSKIKSCSCEDVHGFAIGKLTYNEVTYYVAGKTREQAEHAKPRITGITQTMEIFRWDHHRWFSY